MRNITIPAMTALALFFCIPVIAQKIPLVISGRVISEDESSPLEGAAIVVKGTENSTGTMADGAFTLSVATDDTIVVSLSGYETKKIKITKETFYEVALKHARGLSQPVEPAEKIYFAFAE